MPKYEIAIAVADEADLPSGHKRKKEGDIVSVLPYPVNWGRKMIDQYFILIVESNDDLNTMRKLTIKHYSDGTEWYPSMSDYNWWYFNPPKVLAKHRYRIPLDIIKTGWITDLDLDKVRNKAYIYQPFKSDKQLVQKFDGLNDNRLLSKAEVDCNSSAAQVNKEFVLDMTEQVAVVFDKYKESYEYSTQKVG